MQHQAPLIHWFTHLGFGLGWVELGWVGLGWVGLGWVGLGWVRWVGFQQLADECSARQPIEKLYI